MRQHRVGQIGLDEACAQLDPSALARRIGAAAEWVAPHVEGCLREIRSCPGGGLLAEQASSHIGSALWGAAVAIVEDTWLGLVESEASSENPLAAFDLRLLTDRQRAAAELRLAQKASQGQAALPSTLDRVLRRRLENLSDALVEMLGRLLEHRERICSSLLDGNCYTRILDIQVSAGDTHNGGRSVAVLSTDAGMLVYKPHDMRGDAKIRDLVQRHFSDVLELARCEPFGFQFGVCEYMDKRRACGPSEAAAFSRNLGGAAAVIKAFGGTDMHVENVGCRGVTPVIYDLETFFSPMLAAPDFQIQQTDLLWAKTRSPYLSGLLPNYLSNANGGREISPLMNADLDGCAPVVDGRLVPASEYLAQFESGYSAIYQRIASHRAELAEEARELASQTAVRVLLRPTHTYYELLRKLCHRDALASKEARRDVCAGVLDALLSSSPPELKEVAEFEMLQLEAGDIPYFYAQADERCLRAQGEVVARDALSQSALEHALDNLHALDEQDERFDLGLLQRSIRQYPTPLSEARDVAALTPAECPLDEELAIQEAGELFNALFNLGIALRNKDRLWLHIDDENLSLRFCDAGLASGVGGIAVFAATYANVAGESGDRELALEATDAAKGQIEYLLDAFDERREAASHQLQLGQASGLGGILETLALLKRSTGDEEFGLLQNRVLRMLGQLDLSHFDANDRMGGMAGLLSILCRFEEYRRSIKLIRGCADALLARKTLKRAEGVLWKTHSNFRGPLSGAGHGMAGIAEALFAAGAILGDEACFSAAADALSFERRVYRDDLGTWPDLRSSRSSFMHGYCSGAPGIGIMMRRIAQAGADAYGVGAKACLDLAKDCALRAAASTDALPLNLRDHLCCGNAAIAEYYLCENRREQAGRVLEAMRLRKQQAGEYCYLSPSFANAVSAPLFHGVSGIGYEMLRYARPDQVPSVL